MKAVSLLALAASAGILHAGQASRSSAAEAAASHSIDNAALAVVAASAPDASEARIPVTDPLAHELGPLPEIRAQSGDTVYAIARRTGTSPQAIILVNRLAPPYHLQIGQIIRVPRNNDRSLAAKSDQPAHAPRSLVIRAGDTLYSLSRATGVSIETLARANNLRPPYKLRIGDVLHAPIVAGERTAGIRSERAALQEKAPDPMFIWPINGSIMQPQPAGGFGPDNYGVNIAAPLGTPVRAAADGVVTYCGQDLDGYGNLLLIEHPDGYVTAYAHNDSIRVDKGERVRQGEIVASVGQSGWAPQPQLYFEIRRNQQSINPLAFLAAHPR